MTDSILNAAGVRWRRRIGTAHGALRKYKKVLAFFFGLSYTLEVRYGVLAQLGEHLLDV